jgi:hypothetical protein
MEEPSGLNGFSWQVTGKGRMGSGTVFLPAIATRPAPGAKNILWKFLRTLPTFTPAFAKTGETASSAERVFLSKECYTVPREGRKHRDRAASPLL